MPSLFSGAPLSFTKFCTADPSPERPLFLLDEGPDFLGLRLLTPLRPIWLSFFDSSNYRRSTPPAFYDPIQDPMPLTLMASILGDAVKPFPESCSWFFLLPQLGRDLPERDPLPAFANDVLRTEAMIVALYSCVDKWMIHDRSPAIAACNLVFHGLLLSS